MFIPCRVLAGLPVLFAAVVLLSPAPAEVPADDGWAEIRVIDPATGRGVPLVELETVNSLLFVTDNAGRVAFREPGLMGRELYFSVRSHGYTTPKDGFGFAGFRVTPRPGKPVVLKLPRKNLAERLCRLTGEGLYRDSVLLGHKTPLADPLNPGKVGGQDSIQSVVYRDKAHWFWGDTQRMDYPLGLFRMAGAVTPAPRRRGAGRPGRRHPLPLLRRRQRLRPCHDAVAGAAAGRRLAGQPGGRSRREGGREAGRPLLAAQGAGGRAGAGHRRLR